MFPQAFCLTKMPLVAKKWKKNRKRVKRQSNLIEWSTKKEYRVGVESIPFSVCQVMQSFQVIVSVPERVLCSWLLYGLLFFLASAPPSFFFIYLLKDEPHNHRLGCWLQPLVFITIFPAKALKLPSKIWARGEVCREGDSYRNTWWPFQNKPMFISHLECSTFCSWAAALKNFCLCWQHYLLLHQTRPWFCQPWYMWSSRILSQIRVSCLKSVCMYL